MRVLTIRSKKLFFIVRMVVYVLKLIGLAPFSIGTASFDGRVSQHVRIRVFRTSKIGLAYNLSITIGLLFVTVFAVPTPVSVKPSFIISYVIVVLIRYFRLLAACIIIIFWALQQKSAASILNRLLEVDVWLSGLGRQPFDTTAFVFFTIHVIVNAYLWIDHYCMDIIGDDTYGLSLWIFETVVHSIIYWFILQYFTIVSIVARDLQAVNNHMKAFQKSVKHWSLRPQLPNSGSVFGGGSTLYSGRLASLEFLRGIRTRLSELCEDIAAFFAFPILFCITASFVPLFNGWFTVIVFDDSAHYTATSIALWVSAMVLMFLYPVASLSFSITRTENEAGLTGKIVHKILATEVRQEIRAKLKEFSLQLLHEKFDFSAYGIFTLDSTLLLSFLGGTTTYFIILMQFRESACISENASTINRGVTNGTI